MSNEPSRRGINIALCEDLGLLEKSVHRVLKPPAKQIRLRSNQPWECRTTAVRTATANCEAIAAVGTSLNRSGGQDGSIVGYLRDSSKKSP